jgi:hypothetical protein
MAAHLPDDGDSSEAAPIALQGGNGREVQGDGLKVIRTTQRRRQQRAGVLGLSARDREAEKCGDEKCGHQGVGGATFHAVTS